MNTKNFLMINRTVSPNSDQRENDSVPRRDPEDEDPRGGGPSLRTPALLIGLALIILAIVLVAFS
jgi:hypothetical protein